MHNQEAIELRDLMDENDTLRQANHELKARLSEVTALMRYDIRCGVVTETETRANVLALCDTLTR